MPCIGANPGANRFEIGRFNGLDFKRGGIHREIHGKRQIPCEAPFRRRQQLHADRAGDGVLGHQPIARPLAARDGEEVAELGENLVLSREPARSRVALSLLDKGPQPGKRCAHVLLFNWVLQIAACRHEKERDLVLGGLGFKRDLLLLNVRGADLKHAVPGDAKDEPPVACLRNHHCGRTGKDRGVDHDVRAA